MEFLVHFVICCDLTETTKKRNLTFNKTNNNLHLPIDITDNITRKKMKVFIDGRYQDIARSLVTDSAMVAALYRFGIQFEDYTITINHYFGKILLTPDWLMR